ncbi:MULTISPECIES: DUF6891 domain-containing protein [Corynebacterium]|uniref:DUF6891 domain-containing protein n=1 Tax=Corynebacterium singulare TaxID=161899 RepID=A0ABS9PWM7_9CORY|nr:MULTISPECIES: hypothetical protein [Corynebacterium]MCG7277102.1 hypothetical protein [Corynebacterium singulare]OFT60833.1 hypothetical protein HMPREF3149_07100 [Corynebacterium sp. HMSC05E07]
MTTQHPMFSSSFPPSDDLLVSGTLRNDISLHLCHGHSRRDIHNDFFELLDSPDEWEMVRKDPFPEDFDAIIDEVAAEYAQKVTEKSADAQRLENLRDELQQRDLVFSFDEGWDASEGAEYGAEKAEEDDAAGYVYCHMQDVDRLIHTGDLLFGFGTMKTDAELSTAEAVGERLVEALRASGFDPEWDGNPNARVLCQGLVVEFPLADDLTD